MGRIYSGFTMFMASLCLMFFIAFSAYAASIKDPVEIIVKDEGPAPAFEYIDDIYENLSPEYSKNTITAVHFWATWCVPCNEEMPMLVDIEKEYGSRGVVFVGASLDDAKTKGRIPDFLGKYQITFPIGMEQRVMIWIS